MNDALSQLADHDRVVILGGPRTGKSSLAARAGERYGLPVRSADVLVGHVPWGEDSAEVARWFDEPGRWVIEGVSTVRAVRKWLANNPDKPFPAAVLWLSQPLVAVTKGQQSMAKGVLTVWTQTLPELLRRGATILQG